MHSMAYSKCFVDCGSLKICVGGESRTGITVDPQTS